VPELAMSLLNENSFLPHLGWDDKCETFWKELGRPDLYPARIVSQEKTLYRTQFSKEIIVPAKITGKIWNGQESTTDLPAVGDWVACSTSSSDEIVQIHHIFPRKSILQRKHPGTTPIMQLIATNVDYMFIATSLNEDFNIRRIERYLRLAGEGGVNPILLLTKSDLSTDHSEILKILTGKFSELTIFFLTQEDPKSLDVLKPYFEVGMTSVLLGSSGVGKSTLVNFLTDSKSQKTQKLSRDSKGKHTTTSRQLLFTKWGGLIIDTPGMKEISFQDESDHGVDYSDIEDIFLNCKFNDCKHKSEPGCAVVRALKDHSLTKERWDSYIQRNNHSEKFLKNSELKNKKYDSRRNRN
jgi:ribosome biogenesis GTPase